ncbi:MAG TPA: response regulator [Vicinamibacterales bacterium]|jgi:CheY-like chemotaxis protein|nr:response regulator [Vicinamibacterales bacterium]
MPPDRPLVLLVDNYADNREMYAEYLRTLGFRVIACSDAEASLGLARMCIPDIILLELRMNRMNGVEVLTQLQQEPSLAHVPVVALTASVLSYERAIAMAAGFTELLPKPCFPEDLANAIVRIITAAERPARADGDGHSRLRAGQRAESPRRAAAPSPSLALTSQSPR